MMSMLFPAPGVYHQKLFKIASFSFFQMLKIGFLNLYSLESRQLELLKILFYSSKNSDFNCFGAMKWTF